MPGVILKNKRGEATADGCMKKKKLLPKQNFIWTNMKEKSRVPQSFFLFSHFQAFRWRYTKIKRKEGKSKICTNLYLCILQNTENFKHRNMQTALFSFFFSPLELLLRSSSSWAPWRSCRGTVQRIWSCDTGSGGGSSPRWDPNRVRKILDSCLCAHVRIFFLHLSGKTTAAGDQTGRGAASQRWGADEGEGETAEGGERASRDGEETSTGEIILVQEVNNFTRRRRHLNCCFISSDPGGEEHSGWAAPRRNRAVRWSWRDEGSPPV